MVRKSKPRVVIHVAKGVSFRADVLVGDDVDVFCVDENCPGDRVFRYTPNSVPPRLMTLSAGRPSATRATSAMPG